MAGKSDLPPLTAPQLEIMHLLWEREEATVTDVWQVLSADREVARNTVLTVVDRLAKRGWLEKKPIANTHLYRPTISREEALGTVVERLVDTAFAGSADRMVMALLDGRGVTADEASRIRDLIDASRKKKSKKAKKKTRKKKS